MSLAGRGISQREKDEPEPQSRQDGASGQDDGSKGRDWNPRMRGDTASLDGTTATKNTGDMEMDHTE